MPSLPQIRHLQPRLTLMGKTGGGAAKGNVLTRALNKIQFSEKSLLVQLKEIWKPTYYFNYPRVDIQGHYF